MRQPGPSRIRAKPPAAYRHGTLRVTLLAAAEQMLERDGFAGFSLRACARRAGVSHAAPAHHFPDAAALLTAVAASGFDRLTAAMRRAGRAAGPKRALAAIGRAYVETARGHPGAFRLMFHSDRVDRADIGFRLAAEAAYAVLAETLADAIAPRRPAVHDLRYAWSVVHGFATLSIEGRFGATGGVESLDAILKSVAAGVRAGSARPL